MRRGISLSLRLLLGSMLLSALFAYGYAGGGNRAAGTPPKPAQATPADVSGYCRYQPDWPLFMAGKQIVQHTGRHTGAPGAPGTRDAYEIILPKVNQRITEYRKPDEIPLRRGDVLTVNACGCVQTGGKGDTWKRYVNPSGDNSDKLYHGVIWVRNAAPTGLPESPKVEGFVRISDLLAWQNKDAGNRLRIIANGYLALGYEDDDCKDNGYTEHDDGNDGQCKNVGGAAVSIIIDHH